MRAIPGESGVSDNTPGVTSLGFLTVLREANGYLGGYLVVNGWGRPLEFRLTSAVQPNRVQQILYGGTLEPFICADLIGKTLVEKAGVAVQLVVTDREEILDLRRKLETPVVWVAPGLSPQSSAGRASFACHPHFGADAEKAREMLNRLDAAFDLAEPFQRIREAIGEARKMGVASR